MEGWRAFDGSQVSAEGNMMSDSGEVEGLRELSETECSTVTADIEESGRWRSQGDGSRWNDTI